jgi:type IV secretion system protein VirD4
MNDRPAIPYGFNPERGTFPSYTDNRHLLTFGPTRSGKGATVIVPALLQVSHSVICIDPKGQNAAITLRQRQRLGQKVYVLNPFGLHAGAPWNLPRHRFNPLAHLDINNENVVAEVGSLAEALIITNSKDPYFDDTARDLVRLLILHLLHTRKAEASLPEVRRLLTVFAARDKAAADLMLDLIDSPLPFVHQPAGRFASDSRDIQSAVNAAITQTSFLDDPALSHPKTGTLSGHDFSILDLKKRPTTVYLILPGRFMEAYARFFRLVIAAAIDQLTSEAGGHPTLMLLDEFATLQNLPAISKAFGFAAGYNLQCWPFLQDLPQLKTIYGETRWESFVANAGLVQFFTPADMTTAEWLAKRGGQRHEVQEAVSVNEVTKEQARKGFTGTGTTYSQVVIPVLPPERTMNLPSESQLVFFGGVHGYREVGRSPYWKIPRLARLFDIDPYHQP